MNQDEWPEDIVIKPTKGTEEEAKMAKDSLAVTIYNQQDAILEKCCLSKALLVKSWINRFITNCKRSSIERIKRPLTTVEVEEQKHRLIEKKQESCQNMGYCPEHQLRLNSQRNSNGLPECRGKVQVDYPIFILKKSSLAEKIIMDAYLRAIHVVVCLTTTELRSKCWMPKLRCLA